MIRQPIVAVLGHVDHGKTSLLDKIRGSAVATREAGGITQAIGASIIPTEALKQICGTLLTTLKREITIPGLLFIDTPGHAAFTSLRKRGGNIADMAILVIDINEGIQPQTKESISILKASKTPFIIAANKVDIVKNWSAKKKMLLQNINEQSEETRKDLDNKLYTIVGNLYEQGFTGERFDRVESYTTQIAIVPVSAKTGEGIPELLLVLMGLAQKYLEDSLKTKIDGIGKATVLEVKQHEGLGTVLDCILYDGMLNVKDEVIIGTTNGPKRTRIKALLQPAPKTDIREKKTKFTTIQRATAATGIRIKLFEDEEIHSGMPLITINDEKEVPTSEQWIQEQITTTDIPTTEEGVIIKADTIGSLEALSILLAENNIPVSSAGIGTITKKEITDARSQKEEHQCIITFNIPHYEEQTNIKLIQHNIIYSIIDEYKQYIEQIRRTNQKQAMMITSKPAKVQLLKQYLFRQSSPAVIGCEVVEGILQTGAQLMNKKGEIITQVKGIQENKENKTELKKGEQAAISLNDVTIGRTLQADETLYTVIDEEEYKKYKEHKDAITETEKKALKEIATIMREKNPVWGI